VENKTIEITIENQPFTPYTDANNHHISLYYNITYKGHYEETWHRYLGDFRKASDDAYTVLIKLGLNEIPDGSKIDFRVQAFIGYYTIIDNPPQQFGDPYHLEYTGETSGWSETQTITVGEEQTPNPSPVPDKLVNTIVVGVIIVVIGAGVGVLICLIKRK
jgi:hypothetical protein